MAPGCRRVGIVGGGLGGLAAACTLAARGHVVTLFERSTWLGGKACVLEEAGFRFDMGPTILTLPSVLRRIFAEAGRKLKDELPLVRCDPQWRCFYSDLSQLDLVADRDRMLQHLAAYAKGSEKSYAAFLDFSKVLHDISERFFFWRPVGSLWDMFSLKGLFDPALLRDVLRMRLGKTVAEAVRAHVPDPRVAQMIDHFTQYVGSAPDASPAVLCGIAHMQTQEGIWYPLGGTGAVPRALAKLAAELGVELRTGAGVKRILVEGGRAAGVELDSGQRVPLAAVVSNADSVRTHRELLGGPPAQRFERRRPYEPACSGVVLYLGLEKAYEHLAHHNFVFSRNPHEEFEWIYRKGEPAPDPTCYVCAPSRSEPEVAPPGGESLYILVHTPYLRPHHDWKRMLPEYRRVILQKLADCADMGDLQSRIRFEAHLTPQDIHERYRVLNGAIYGLASHGRFQGGFKPSNRSPDVKGLYLAGGAAHPGPGMPMVLMSGWIAADALDRDRAGWASGGREPPVARQTKREERETEGEAVLPRRSPWRVRFFARYFKRYLGRNFHAVRLSRAGKPPVLEGRPLVVVLNHPSWWDPLMGVALAELFPGYAHFVPIEAAALAKYRVFEPLGFFGVEQTPEGALAFLKTASAILARPRHALWITAQGKFTDPRARPVSLRPGAGHVLRRLEGAVVLPLALEYPFWQERYPEALAHFGAPIVVGRGRDHAVEEWLARLEAGLTTAQDALAAVAQTQDAEAFETLIGGKVGIGGVYDWWRRLRAWLGGRRFQPSHAERTGAHLGRVS
jgi:phytoene desaturase